MCSFSGGLVLILVLLDFIQKSTTLQLLFGECPVYFYERCTHREAVKFTLYTKSYNETLISYDLDPFNPELPGDFDVSIPLKVIIHGYGGLEVDISTGNVTKAYQDVGYNVIIVDWEPLARLPCYTTAYLNTWHVAQCLTILVVNLLPLGLKAGIIHVVGFSLGAHISGLAGNNLQNAIGKSFYRITGLDPALPFFATLNNDWKLDKTDADFVDVIHTSAGTFGKLEATGHVDFYVNGGSLQPYCLSKKYPPLCSHIMAGLYFAESIRSSIFGGDSFIARKCENLAQYLLGLCNGSKELAIMGENVYYLTRGTYYLETADQPPYALGFKSYHFSDKQVKEKSFLSEKLQDFFKILC